MSDSNSLTPPPVSQPEPRSRPFAWLVGTIVACTLTAILAAHLPDRAKLLGLFPLIWGATVGAGLRWWANECYLRPSRWLLIATSLGLAAGEAGIVLEAWRMHQFELQSTFDKDPSAGFLKQAQQIPTAQATPEEAALRQQLRAEVERVREVRRYRLSLPAFLQRRLKPLGVLSPPWPEIFWAGEIIFGSLAGVWIMKLWGTDPDSSAVTPTSSV